MSIEFQEGATLAGKYRVDRVLGVGGMGVVVAAHHLELDDKVAIKFLLPETLANAEAVARFAREARAAVKIKSEHVARVSDVGKLDNGAPYMVMEYLEGSDLSQWLAERGPLPVEQAIDFILQASEAIAEAHSLGIVHRDLKPANLFVIRRADGAFSIKVLDFGISKMGGLSGSGSEASMTRTSTMMGSPLYMSPEQIRSSKDVDARADIWALGVILYELIAGTAPFEAEHMAELVYRIISFSPPELHTRRPDIPEGLDAVMALCLAKERETRFASVAAMARALAPFASRRAASSVERITGIASGGYPQNASAPVPLTPTAAIPAAAGTAASWGTTAIEKRRSPWLLVSGAALSLVIGSAGALKYFASGAPSASALPAAAASPPAPPVVPVPPPPKPETPAITAPTPPSSAPSPSASAVATAKPKAPLAARSAVPRSPESPKAKPPPKSDTPFDQWGESRH